MVGHRRGRARPLDVQVKFVVEAIKKEQRRRRKRTAKTGAMGERVPRTPGERTRMPVISKAWGHRETVMFRNVLMTYGPGKWEMLRVRSHFALYV